jgi:hypothetical protein
MCCLRLHPHQQTAVPCPCSFAPGTGPFFFAHRNLPPLYPPLTRIQLHASYLGDSSVYTACYLVWGYWWLSSVSHHSMGLITRIDCLIRFKYHSISLLLDGDRWWSYVIKPDPTSVRKKKASPSVGKGFPTKGLVFFLVPKLDLV